jgi:hypothetical protein
MYSNEETGILRAFTYMEFTDLSGSRRRRRVSVGYSHESLTDAKRSMEAVKAANPDLPIQGKFEIVL